MTNILACAIRLSGYSGLLSFPAPVRPEETEPPRRWWCGVWFTEHDAHWQGLTFSHRPPADLWKKQVLQFWSNEVFRHAPTKLSEYSQEWEWEDMKKPLPSCRSSSGLQQLPDYRWPSSSLCSYR